MTPRHPSWRSVATSNPGGTLTSIAPWSSASSHFSTPIYQRALHILAAAVQNHTKTGGTSPPTTVIGVHVRRGDILRPGWKSTATPRRRKLTWPGWSGTWRNRTDRSFLSSWAMTWLIVDGCSRWRRMWCLSRAPRRKWTWPYWVWWIIWFWRSGRSAGGARTCRTHRMSFIIANGRFMAPNWIRSIGGRITFFPLGSQQSRLARTKICFSVDIFLQLLTKEGLYGTSVFFSHQYSCFHHWSIGWTEWSIDYWIDWLIDSLTYWLLNRLIDWLIDWLVIRVIDWSDWLIDWLGLIQTAAELPAFFYVAFIHSCSAFCYSRQQWILFWLFWFYCALIWLSRR